MLSDEEKKAIERAEFLIKIDTYLEKEMLTNLLNLIERQSKEIEELNRLKGFEMLNIFNRGKQSSRQRIEFDYVDKDKIKARIKELEKENKKLNLIRLQLEKE